MIRRQIFYGGAVQGVGFRWTAARTAGSFAVSGFVRNLDDGRVEMAVEGERGEVEGFCAAVETRMSGYIERTEAAELPATGEFAGFTIEQ
jgi:acylphosphatase